MKEQIIKMLKTRGWTYEEKYWSDGSVMTWIFKQLDTCNKDAYWMVSIEDHHDDGDWDDWFIYTCYHDPNEIDWDGRQIDTSCCVEYQEMKLIMEFVDTLDKELRGE